MGISGENGSIVKRYERCLGMMNILVYVYSLACANGYTGVNMSKLIQLNFQVSVVHCVAILQQSCSKKYIHHYNSIKMDKIKRTDNMLVKR